jgi:hypothetical protein
MIENNDIKPPEKLATPAPKVSDTAICSTAFTNLWVRWMKKASHDSKVRDQKMLCEDSFNAGWEEAKAYFS